MSVGREIKLLSRDRVGETTGLLGRSFGCQLIATNVGHVVFLWSVASTFRLHRTFCGLPLPLFFFFHSTPMCVCVCISPTGYNCVYHLCDVRGDNPPMAHPIGAHLYRIYRWATHTHTHTQRGKKSQPLDSWEEIFVFTAPPRWFQTVLLFSHTSCVRAAMLS